MNMETIEKAQIYHNTHNPLLPPEHHMPDVEARSEERRVGKEC